MSDIHSYSAEQEAAVMGGLYLYTNPDKLQHIIEQTKVVPDIEGKDVLSGYSHHYPNGQPKVVSKANESYFFVRAAGL